MSDTNIITTIENLRSRMDERFDAVDTKFDTITTRFDKRVRKNEIDISRIKTAGVSAGLVLTFFGWDSIKLWLTSLTK